jgi:hypothetical protein
VQINIYPKESVSKLSEMNSIQMCTNCTTCRSLNQIWKLEKDLNPQGPKSLAARLTQFWVWSVATWAGVVWQPTARQRGGGQRLLGGRPPATAAEPATRRRCTTGPGGVQVVALWSKWQGDGEPNRRASLRGRE